MNTPHSAFKDHFSASAGGYAQFRPRYPRALSDWLADNSPDTGLAWDCGCGNGQLSVILAERFARVGATDASAEQITQAEPHPRVGYRCAPAESSGLPDGSADLIVAAQAAHWFDLPAFYAEARRVGRPGALLALVCYELMEIHPAIDPVVRRFYGQVLDPFWPPERRLVEQGYRTMAFPFPEIAPPLLAMEATWDLPHLLGYVATWSALRKAEAALGSEPMERFRRELSQAWGDPEQTRPIRWPISMRVGRLQVLDLSPATSTLVSSTTFIPSY